MTSRPLKVILMIHFVNFTNGSYAVQIRWLDTFW